MAAYWKRSGYKNIKAPVVTRGLTKILDAVCTVNSSVYEICVKALMIE
jgi:hypothetical protein